MNPESSNPNFFLHKAVKKGFTDYTEKTEEVKPLRMSRSVCGWCGQKVNTFIVDSFGRWDIRLCKKCATREVFPIEFSRTCKCLRCGEIFIPIKSKICPVCWRKQYECWEDENGFN